ncbi:MAG: YicC family protein [Blautia sp.]|nr:YicC family protein [Blautia sp.]
MIRSMTGFGRAEAINDRQRITAEIRSVNHRYLDLSIKLPRRLSFLEGQIRGLLKEYIQRGKVDLFLTYDDYSLGSNSVSYHGEVAARYLEGLRAMSADLGLKDDITCSVMARLPEVFTMDEKSIDEEMLWHHIEPVIKEACEAFTQSREREGANLYQDLRGKLSLLEEKVRAVQERSPQVVDQYREKLESKVKEILADTSVEESRIAAEVIIFADKICNDEETVRLHSHITGMERLLDDSDGIGRKLDFIAQEMNREANTILSKSGDLEISNLAIDIKTEIEKIREQVQNIE